MAKLCEGCSARGGCSGEVISVVNADFTNRASFKEATGGPRGWACIILEDEERNTSKAVTKLPGFGFGHAEEWQDVVPIIEMCPNQGLPVDEQDPSKCKLMEGRAALPHDIATTLGYLAREALS